MKSRLDVYMTEKGMVKSRAKAQELIKAGKVLVNGKVAMKSSLEVGDTDAIELTEVQKFVSRGGEKLEHALVSFKIDVAGLTALDVGSSTGGFTDCLLQRGAARVIAVDVGRGQLDSALREDARVELHESTDVRSLALDEKVDLVVADVSFISLEHVVGHIKTFMKPGAVAVFLVKPQFEVGKGNHDKRGVVTDAHLQRASLEKIKAKLSEEGYTIKGETESPIKGGDGNTEYLVFAQL